MIACKRVLCHDSNPENQRAGDTGEGSRWRPGGRRRMQSGRQKTYTRWRQQKRRLTSDSTVIRLQYYNTSQHKLLPTNSDYEWVGAQYQSCSKPLWGHSWPVAVRSHCISSWDVAQPKPEGLNSENKKPNVMYLDQLILFLCLPVSVFFLFFWSCCCFGDDVQCYWSPWFQPGDRKTGTKQKDMTI